MSRLIAEHAAVGVGSEEEAWLLNAMMDELKDEMRLLDELAEAAAEAGLAQEFRDQVIDTASTQKTHLQQVLKQLRTGLHDSAEQCTADLSNLRRAVKAAARYAKIPRLQKLVGGIREGSNTETESELIPLQVLRQLGEALDSYDWRAAPGGVREACFDEFAQHYLRALTREAQRSLESGDTEILEAEVRPYREWGLSTQEAASSKELRRIIVALAMRDGCANPLLWLDFARHLSGRTGEEARVSTIKSDVETANTISDGISGLWEAAPHQEVSELSDEDPL